MPGPDSALADLFTQGLREPIVSPLPTPIHSQAPGVGFEAPTRMSDIPGASSYDTGGDATGREEARQEADTYLAESIVYVREISPYKRVDVRELYHLVRQVFVRDLEAEKGDPTTQVFQERLRATLDDLSRRGVPEELKPLFDRIHAIHDASLPEYFGYKTVSEMPTDVRQAYDRVSNTLIFAPSSVSTRELFAESMHAMQAACLKNVGSQTIKSSAFSRIVKQFGAGIPWVQRRLTQSFIKVHRDRVQGKMHYLHTDEDGHVVHSTLAPIIPDETFEPPVTTRPVLTNVVDLSSMGKDYMDAQIASWVDTKTEIADGIADRQFRNTFFDVRRTGDLFYQKNPSSDQEEIQWLLDTLSEWTNAEARPSQIEKQKLDENAQGKERNALVTRPLKAIDQDTDTSNEDPTGITSLQDILRYRSSVASHFIIHRPTVGGKLQVLVPLQYLGEPGKSAPQQENYPIVDALSQFFPSWLVEFVPIDGSPQRAKQVIQATIQRDEDAAFIDDMQLQLRQMKAAQMEGATASVIDNMQGAQSSVAGDEDLGLPTEEMTALTALSETKAMEVVQRAAVFHSSTTPSYEGIVTGGHGWIGIFENAKTASTIQEISNLVDEARHELTLVQRDMQHLHSTIGRWSDKAGSFPVFGPWIGPLAGTFSDMVDIVTPEKKGALAPLTDIPQQIAAGEFASHTHPESIAQALQFMRDRREGVATQWEMENHVDPLPDVFNGRGEPQRYSLDNKAIETSGYVIEGADHQKYFVGQRTGRANIYVVDRDGTTTPLTRNILIEKLLQDRTITEDQANDLQKELSLSVTHGDWQQRMVRRAFREVANREVERRQARGESADIVMPDIEKPLEGSWSPSLVRLHALAFSLKRHYEMDPEAKIFEITDEIDQDLISSNIPSHLKFLETVVQQSLIPTGLSPYVYNQVIQPVYSGQRIVVSDAHPQVIANTAAAMIGKSAQQIADAIQDYQGGVVARAWGVKGRFQAGVGILDVK